MTDWTQVNRVIWDERAPAHAKSPDYAVEQFVADPTYLSDEVRFDLPRLGPVDGLRAVHLQCHIGTDTLSLHRLGARVTGLDFSAAALDQARALVNRTGTDPGEIDFVEAELYEAPAALPPGEFDLVFTGIGALCWLPDIRRWAQVVAGLLKPGGRLFLREGHPIVWTLDTERSDGLIVINSPYFERPEPTVWDDDGTYVETDQVFTATRSADWNHGLGEIITALFDAGLQLTALEEHDSAPWATLPVDQLERLPTGEFRLRDAPWRLPQTYTLQAVKR